MYIYIYNYICSKRYSKTGENERARWISAPNFLENRALSISLSDQRTESAAMATNLRSSEKRKKNINPFFLIP